MRYHLATNQQLETIFNHEGDSPNYLLVGVVTEMMKRNLFDGMIVSIAKRFMSQYDREEVKQAAYIGIYQLANYFKPGKLTFKQLTYISIERRLKTLLQKKFARKNFINEDALNNEFPILTESQNVEKTVIDHITLEEQLEKLTEKERYIVEQFLKGYSIAYMAAHDFKQDAKAIHYHFNKALKKMNITDYKIGARCGLKGA